MPMPLESHLIEDHGYARETLEGLPLADLARLHFDDHLLYHEHGVEGHPA